MARFNQPTIQSKRTENLAGGLAYSQTPEIEFVSIMLTSFVQDQYYRGSTETINRLVQLIDDLCKQGKEQFVAKAAIYARNEFGMRSISHVAAATLAAHIRGYSWGKNFYEQIVRRPDDMTEIRALLGRQLPNAVRKGFKAAFNKFDTYQLAKYQAKSKNVSLADVVNAVHPIPTVYNAAGLEGIAKDTLRSTETWETKLVQAGQTGETEEEVKNLKAEAWRDLINNRKLGYFALLRNLRNIVEQAPDMIDAACKMLRDEELIKGSLVMPFRFFTTYRELRDAPPKVLEAISDALELSVQNVPELDNTLVVVDVSGSMNMPMSKYSNAMYWQIGMVMAAILAKRSGADFMCFATKAEYDNFNPKSDVLDIVKNYRLGKLGYGTDFHAIFNTANKPYDRIIIFSDMQSWIGYKSGDKSLNRYATNYNCMPHVYTVDLSGYGTAQFPENRIYQLAGFSDKIFDIITLLESDKQALVNKINAVKLMP